MARARSWVDDGASVYAAADLGRRWRGGEHRSLSQAWWGAGRSVWTLGGGDLFRWDPKAQDAEPQPIDSDAYPRAGAWLSDERQAFAGRGLWLASGGDEVRWLLPKEVELEILAASPGGGRVAAASRDTRAIVVGDTRVEELSWPRTMSEIMTQRPWVDVAWIGDTIHGIDDAYTLRRHRASDAELIDRLEARPAPAAS